MRRCALHRKRRRVRRWAHIDEWRAGATEYPGSWWNDWDKWLSAKSGAKVPARVPGSGGLPAIEDAPGSYVKVRLID